MDFKRYPSIINHDNKKDIDRWLEYHPSIWSDEYVITEKAHGTNVSVLVNQDGSVQHAKRTSILEPDEKFYDYQTVMCKYVDEIKMFQEYAKDTNAAVRVYGEMFGGSIQKGVNYGKDKHFRIFDLMVNDVWLSHYEQVELIQKLSISHLMIPILGFASNLTEALNFNVNINSTLFSVDGENIMEGGVAKPSNKVYCSPDGSKFSIKIKNQAFKDKQKEKKIVRDPSN